MALVPGTKVRVVNPHHWLFDRIGHVVKLTLDANIKASIAGAHGTSAGVAVDFGRRWSGWYNTPLKGERKAKTHTCDGALKLATGYYMLERDLKIEDVPSSLDVSPGGIATPRAR